jgi:signal peptide peptidase SppA
MAYPYLLSSILKETWAIEPRHAESMGVLVASLLNGIEMEPAGDLPVLQVHTPTGDLLDGLPSAESILPDYNKAPKGSIAIIPLKGSMTKEDTLCSYGATSIAKFIRHAADHKNIAGIVLDIDSGGGAVNAIAPLIDAIEHAKSKKPVVAYADTAASAAYYTAVYCDQIILANDISAQVGSVGVMISFADMQPYYEKMGVKFHTVYAPESTHKNQAFELALQGKYDLIKSELLSPLARKFQDAVKKQRPNLNLSVEGIIAGKMFFATDALKHNMVDGIGNMEQALDVCEKLAQRSNSNIHSQKNARDMKFNAKIASLLTILAYTMLESKDGMVSLSEADIKQIKDAYKAKHKKELELQGLTFEDGHATLAEATLESIAELYDKDPQGSAAGTSVPPAGGAPGAAAGAAEGAGANADGGEGGAQESNAALEARIEQLVAQGSQNTQLIQKLMAQLERMSNPQTDIFVIPNNPAHAANGSKHNGYFNASGESWDKADALRPYNMRALGMPVVEGTSSLDLTTLIQDLGDYSKRRRQDLISFMRDNNILDVIFPFISGVNNIDVFTNMFLGEFTQAAQKAWTPKGTFKIQAEQVQIFPVKIDHAFEDMKAIETTWLSDLNKEGSNAYKTSFVGYLIKQMLLKAAQEDAIAAIKGVFIEPTPGEAGPYLNRMNGLLKYLRDKIAERKLIPITGLGEWNDTNILDYERQLIGQIPETWRDAPNMALYASKKYMEARFALKKKLEGSDVEYDSKKSTIDGYENIRLIAVPYMGESKRVFITPIGNIRQLEFIPNENKFVELEKEKRVINAICDYKRGIQALAVGKKWEDSETPNLEHQMIWCNDVDLPASQFVKMIANDTTPSAKEHTSLESVDNTQATAITNIDDLPVGSTCILKCGSNTNAPTIAKSGNFSKMSAAWNPSLGDTITLYRRGASDIVDLGRTTATTTATAFTADDATPSVDGATVFITVANTAATAITKLDDATVGEIYTIHGGSDTNAATIANSGNFSLTAAMTLSLGKWIKLYAMAGGKFVELDRSPA